MTRVRVQNGYKCNNSNPRKGGLQDGEDPPDSMSDAEESVVAEDTLSENGFPTSPLISAPTPGLDRKISRRRRLTNFLLMRGHRRGHKHHDNTHRRKKHHRWIRRKPSHVISSSSTSSSMSDDSSMDSEEDSVGSLEDERIGRPPMCGASYSDWGVPSANSYNVRQFDYKQTKQKDESANPSFYELCATDTYCSPSRMDRIFEHIERIEEVLGCPPPSGHPDIPRILILNCQLPNGSPPLSSPGEGPTINIVLFYRLRDDFRRYIELGLGHAEVPPAARLFSHWCANGENDSALRGRFKAIGRALNTEELGLPSVMKRYNGRPILIYGRESSMSFDREQQILELDINAHNFSYFGRRVLYSTYSKFLDALVTFGFLIEARTNDELPEHIVGTSLFRKLDLLSLEQLSWDNDSLVVGDEEDRMLVTAKKYEQDEEQSSKSSKEVENLNEVNGTLMKSPYSITKGPFFGLGSEMDGWYSSFQLEYLSLTLLILVLVLWTTLIYIWKNSNTM